MVGIYMPPPRTQVGATDGASTDMDLETPSAWDDQSKQLDPISDSDSNYVVSDRGSNIGNKPETNNKSLDESLDESLDKSLNKGPHEQPCSNQESRKQAKPLGSMAKFSKLPR